MFRIFSKIFSNLIYIGILYLYYLTIVYPLILAGPLAFIMETVGDFEEDFSFVYVVKVMARYIFWLFIANIFAFFFGGFAIGFTEYLIYTQILPFIRNFF